MKITAVVVLAVVLVPGEILSQRPGSEINSLLVLSNDRKIDATLRKAYVSGMPVEKLESKFPKDRFSFQEWGGSGLIAIDRELPVFAERESNRVLLKSIASCVDSKFVFNVADVPEKDRLSVFRTLESMFPSTDRPTGQDLSAVAFGLDVQINLTMRSGDGAVKKTIGMTAPGLPLQEREDAMKEHTMPTRSAPKEEQESLLRALGDRQAEEEQAQFHTYGWGKYYLADGLRKAADRIEAIQQDMREAEASAAHGILERKGISDLTAGLPRGDFSLGDLPDPYRKELLRMASDSYKAYGFESPEQAVAFVKNSSSRSATVSFGLKRSFRAYDPTSGQIGSGMTYIFYTMSP